MRSKAAVNPPRASAANKPFMTEYRIAYRDPTASKKGKYTSAVTSKASKTPADEIIFQKFFWDGF